MFQPRVFLEKQVTPEGEFLTHIFRTALQGTPKEPVWKWADREVFFTQSMAAEQPKYDSSLTPWTREWQDLIRDPDTTEGVAMKSSQSGYTESSLNVIRWMPSHFPGNVGYVISTDKKAKRISKVRLANLKDTAKDQISNDANDFSTYHIILDNMEITVSGSGSPNPFRETWYRAAFLDEPEDHEELKDGTTYSAIKPRFTTVNDATLFVLGKPQFEGGVVHRAFCKGSQERWMVPCPRCGVRIHLRFENLVFRHCKDLTRAWDFDRVATETYYECQECHGKIEEHEKKAMVLQGEWMPTPTAERMRLHGETVIKEQGVRSFHINDLYSSFPGVAWGILAKKWLSCFVIACSQKDQDDFRTNHLGLPIEPREFTLKDSTLDALKGGVIEEKGGMRIVHGHSFGLSYHGYDCVNDLLFDPSVISITVDKQKEVYKWLVFAWKENGEASLIDIGIAHDEDEVLALRHRPYPSIITPDRPHYIFGGLVDCRYRPKTVFKLCERAQAVGWSLYPVRGSGYHSEFRGKNLRETFDYTEEGLPMIVYDFHDFSIKSDFYLGKIERREEPRLWLPDPIPPQIYTEWTSEKLRIVTTRTGGKKQEWVHDENNDPPNDYGDCGKYQYVFWQLTASLLA